MKKLICVSLFIAVSCGAADRVLIPLKEADTAVLILDRESPDHSRAQVILPPKQSPGRVIVEHRPNPDPGDWTEVRWVIRFDLSRAPATITQARLHLWCQGTAGSPKVAPRLDLIQPADSRHILDDDRASKPLLPKSIEITFPSNPQMIELDVTEFVKEAQMNRLPFAAFRISAVCDKPDCAGDAPQNYYFGGVTNVWSWPKSEPPLLEITP
jgi:hypothetical protein